MTVFEVEKLKFDILHKCYKNDNIRAENEQILHKCYRFDNIYVGVRKSKLL
jgi:hypothetical protein